MKLRQFRTRMGGIRRMKARWWVLSGVVVLVLTGGGAWWIIAAQSTSAEATPVVQTVAASLETMEQSVSASGTLTPTVQEEVSFAASGIVTAVNVVAGTVVAAGDALATVDTLTVDAELLAARATLATAAAKLADSQDSSDGGTADLAQIAANAASVTTAQNGVDEAVAAQNAVTLTAPVAGLVTAVNVAVGDVESSSSSSSTGTSGAASGGTATASSAAFTIVGTDAWTVDLTVGEADVALIEANDQVELSLDDGTAFFGTVSEIGLLPSTTTGVAAYPVVVAVTGTPEGLHDGVTVTASIVYERRTEVLTVVSAAVSSVDGASVVTMLDADGNEVSTPVTVGATAGNLTEITEGLAEGDEVVVATFTPGTGNTGTGTGAGIDTGTFPGGGAPTGDAPTGQVRGGANNG